MKDLGVCGWAMVVTVIVMMLWMLYLMLPIPQVTELKAVIAAMSPQELVIFRSIWIAVVIGWVFK